LFALLLIPILVSGYILVVANLYHFYQLHKYDGQLLYLKVAAFGSFNVIVVMTIAALLKFFFPEFHLIEQVSTSLRIKKIVDANKAEVWLVIISLCSVLSSIVWVSLVKIKDFFMGIFYKKDTHESINHASRLRVLRKTLSTGSLDMMLIDCIEAQKKEPILITLQSRKVYVGIVNGILEPTEDEGANSALSIFPIMSGYRNKNDLTIEFTNAYPGYVMTVSAATSNSVKPVRLNSKMDIIFSADEISHVSWFDFELFDQVNNSLKQPQPIVIPATPTSDDED
jgi:hypothetical protein